MIVVLFIPLLLINFAYDILAKAGIYDISVGIILFSLFFEILIIPWTLYKTFSGYKVKNDKKAIVRHNVIMIVVSILLSLIGIYAAATIPETITAFDGMSSEEITVACTTFGVDMREKGIALNWTLALPMVYVLISTIPSKIRKNRKAKKEREEILKSLSEDDKALYLEEEEKAKQKAKKITVKSVLLNLLPVYSVIICLFISRQIVLYFLMAAMWREIINAILRFALKNKMAVAQEKAKQRLAAEATVIETEPEFAEEDQSNTDLSIDKENEKTQEETLQS